jgi:hypothetical protein
MKSVIFVIGMLVLLAWEAAILHMDYFLRVTDHYTLYYDGRPMMSHVEKGPVVDEVTGYANLVPGVIAGTSTQGYFLAVPDGAVSFFASESGWRTACYDRAGREPGFLAKPSRTEFPMFWKLQVLLIAVALGWLFLFRPRQPKASAPGESLGSP